MFSSPCWPSYSKSFWVVGASTTLTHIHSNWASMMSNKNTALVRHLDTPNPNMLAKLSYTKHNTKQHPFTELMSSCTAAPQKNAWCVTVKESRSKGWGEAYHPSCFAAWCLQELSREHCWDLTQNQLSSVDFLGLLCSISTACWYSKNLSLT